MKIFITCLCIFLWKINFAQGGSYAEYNRLSQATQRAFSVPDRYTITTYSSKIVSSPSNYNTNASSKNYTSKSSNYNSNSNDNSWAMPCRNCNQNWGPSYQQTQRSTVYNADEEIKRKAREEEKALRIKQEQERLDAEYKRQLDEKARLLAIENERLRQQRLAFFKDRLPALKAQPLQTIYTAPTFANNKEKFFWYYNQANSVTGINDAYAKLIVAQMAIDGEVEGRNRIGIAMDNNYDAPFCSLRLCLSAELDIINNKVQEFDNTIILLNAATGYNDITKGDVRAYKKLLQIYRTDSLLGFKLPKRYSEFNERNNYTNSVAKANVFAYAAKNGDEVAASELRSILVYNNRFLQKFPKTILLNIAAALPLGGEYDNYGLFVWDNLAQKMEQMNDTNCITYYLKCLQKNNASQQVVNSMCVSLAKLGLNNSVFEKQVTLQQQKIILQNVNTFSKTYDSLYLFNSYINDTDLKRFFDCFWGNSGIKMDYEKATNIAQDIIKREDNEFEPLQKVALAYRIGTGGWPKNDKKASELFKMASKQILENTDKEKDTKAMFSITTAEYWKANKKLNLQENNEEVGYYLEEAARLGSSYGDDFADWVGNKKAPYFSKEKAIFYYNKTIKWLEDMHDLYVKVEMEDTITGPRIAALKKKISLL